MISNFSNNNFWAIKSCESCLYYKYCLILIYSYTSPFKNLGSYNELLKQKTPYIITIYTVYNNKYDTLFVCPDCAISACYS